MSHMYDDNFGWYEVGPGDDPEEVQAFYTRNAKLSVWKKCARCGRRVKLLPQYGTCNTCMARLERGEDF